MKFTLMLPIFAAMVSLSAGSPLDTNINQVSSFVTSNNGTQYSLGGHTRPTLAQAKAALEPQGLTVYGPEDGVESLKVSRESIHT
jgi:hypothetical protein